jgi:tetraacyldisaccharide 4'-kinase
MLLFFPFAFIYGAIVWVRNRLFDLGFLNQTSFPFPTIAIGNLEMGGSGKTPMSDFLISNFSEKYKIAYLSRGYKRNSTGFILATENSSIEDLGDEAYMIAKKWLGTIVLAVDSDRVNGIKKIKDLYPEINLILLDDSMQHRWVKPKICIQLSPYHLPFFKNSIFPIGTLRDLKKESSRADLIIFTKCKYANEELLDKITREMKSKGYQNDEIFVSSISYKVPVNQFNNELKTKTNVIAIAGLADNKPFFEKVNSEFSVEKVISKPDHYRYLPDFFEKENLAGKTILCTEKDFYKILAIAPKPELIYYQPIGIQIFPEKKLLSFLETSINS